MITPRPNARNGLRDSLMTSAPPSISRGPAVKTDPCWKPTKRVSRDRRQLERGATTMRADPSLLLAPEPTTFAPTLWAVHVRRRVVSSREARQHLFSRLPTCDVIRTLALLRRVHTRHEASSKVSNRANADRLRLKPTASKNAKSFGSSSKR